MMVSKIVVVALVAIVACPILLGYALNLTEVTETGYKMDDDTVNVTRLLQNGVDYEFNAANADYYQLNTKFTEAVNPTYPEYQKITTAKTSFKANQTSVSGTNIINSPATVSAFPTLSYMASYARSYGYITMSYTKTDNTTATIPYFHSLYWNRDAGEAYYSYYTSDTTLGNGIILDLKTITGFSKTGSYNGYMTVLYDYPTEPYYVDLSEGFRIKDTGPFSVVLPSYTQNVLFTINLSSISDASYSMKMSNVSGGGGFNYTLEKSTVAGQVKWFMKHTSDPSISIELYYDQTSSDNTYQFYTDFKKVREDSTYEYYTSFNEFRYVGAWPNLVGEANAYLTYTDTINTTVLRGTDLNFNKMTFSDMTGIRSPQIRFDEAYFMGFEYPVIENNTYKPSTYRNNPGTTLSNITQFGYSLDFGGNTYNVSNGKITIGGHAVPVEGLVLSSVPNGSGTYDNMIGNTFISTTATPSTITFNGKWAASVTTQSMESYTYTKTEWVAGSFAWDGVDTNFLIVGLVTCLGVFVALGIYARKSRSGGIIPLMIVVGGAAMLFFVML